MPHQKHARQTSDTPPKHLATKCLIHHEREQRCFGVTLTQYFASLCRRRWFRGGAVVVPTLSLLLPLGAYGALTAVGVDLSLIHI